MRRIMAALLMGIWAMGLGLSLAEMTAFPTNVEVEKPLAADLNGDGLEERSLWTFETDEYDEKHLCLEIDSDDGGVAHYVTRITEPAALWLAPFDNPTLVVTGTGEDGAPYTYALQYAGEGYIRELLFSADERGLTPADHYTPYGWGVISRMSGNQIALEAPVDVLGTWLGERTYVLNAVGRFVPEDPLWYSAARTDQPEVWENPPLVTMGELSYTDENDRSATLPEGTALIITSTDKQTFARFTTRDGLTGTFTIEPGEPSYEYRYAVEGDPEEEVFEDVDYED